MPLGTLTTRRRRRCCSPSWPPGHTYSRCTTAALRTHSLTHVMVRGVQHLTPLPLPLPLPLKNRVRRPAPPPDDATAALHPAAIYRSQDSQLSPSYRLLFSCSIMHATNPPWQRSPLPLVRCLPYCRRHQSRQRCDTAAHRKDHQELQQVDGAGGRRGGEPRQDVG